MAEERIVVTIDENGTINASTEGLKGEICLKELQDLLGKTGNVLSVSKTDEFYQRAVTKVKTAQSIKRGTP